MVNGFLQIGRAYGAEKSLPMKGEGIAMGHRDYFFGNRQRYDGVQRTARPAEFGSWG